MNDYGSSAYSDTLKVALAALPIQALAPTRSAAGNSESAIALEWSELSEQTIEVLRYSLYVDDGFGVTFTRIMEEKRTEFRVEGL